MNDLLRLIISALGAAAGAVAILAGLTTLGVLLTGALASSAGVLSAALPAVVCAGGVAYAASQTGYGTNG